MKTVSCGPVLTRGPSLVLCATRMPMSSSRVLAARASSSSASPALGGSSMGRKVVPSTVSRKASIPRARRAVRVNALFEKFTERSIKSVMQSQQEAKYLGATEVNTEHILLGLIAESPTFYSSCGISPGLAKEAVVSITGRRAPLNSNETIVFSRSVRRTFEAATNECKRTGVGYISPEHILLALINTPDSVAKKTLDSLSVDCDNLRLEALKRLKGEVESSTPKKKKPAEKEARTMLKEYCKDLVAEVRAGRLDPVIGRSREVSRVIQILGRRTKNNPLLLGEPGVGKTAIAEGLALSIVSKSNPDGTPLPAFLHEKRVMQLDVGLIVAGAKERGELEQRMTKLIAEVKADGNVILMIDEVHTLVGAGSAGRGGGGGLDIANLVKPALARGEFQVIGATTIAEFRKYVEKDAALERRFQPVMVREPTEEETLEILGGLREKYERHHRCVYTAAALEAAVKLSSKYIADRFLPDKAIDLLDEAGSRVRITAYNARRQGGHSESPHVDEYLQVLDTMDEAIKGGLYEEASILQRRQNDYRSVMAGPAAEGSSLPVVDTADIESIVAAWTGIPVENMGQDERDRLIRLSSVMKEHVIGQDEAVDVLASALMRARMGLKDPNRPVASLLFLGPTGVGKTELAKVLAEQYFGSRDSMVRLDMSEYMERHSVSKLIGAPPGYVGYGDGGKLTEAVRRRPCSLILLDEVEKAHPDVFNVLLQLMDEGRLTDSSGRTVSFKNALVVLTSNIGSRLISGSGSGLGAFLRAREASAGPAEPSAEASASPSRSGGSYSEPRRGGSSLDDEDLSYSRRRLKDLVMEEVKQSFRPEFLNRLDEQIVFHKLGRPEVRTIAGLMIQETVRRVEERGYSLELSPALVDRIIAEGHSDEYGVRPLRQTVVRYVDDKLSDTLLQTQVPKGSTLRLDLDPETGDVAVTHSQEDDITVTGHSSGFGGNIVVFTDRKASPSSLGGGVDSSSSSKIMFVRDSQSSS